MFFFCFVFWKILQRFHHNFWGAWDPSFCVLGVFVCKILPTHNNCAPNQSIVRFASGSPFSRVFAFEWVFVFGVFVFDTIFQARDKLDAFCNNTAKYYSRLSWMSTVATINGFHRTSSPPFWCTEQKRKKSFCNLTLLLCKTWDKFTFVFCTNMAVLSHDWIQYLDIPKHLSNLI